MNTTRSSLNLTASNGFQAMISVLFLGGLLTLTAAWISVRLFAPPSGWTYDAWIFAHRTSVAIFYSGIVCIWTGLGFLRFVGATFDEQLFFRRILQSAAVAAASAACFILLSRHGTFAVWLALALYASVVGAMMLFTRIDAPGDVAPVTKLFWSVCGRFLIPGFSVIASSWLVYELNLYGPLSNNTWIITTMGALYTLWRLFFVVGVTALQPQFRPSATFVGSMLFGEMVSLTIAAGLGWVVVQTMARDVVPWLSVYLDNFTQVFAVWSIARELYWRAVSMGMSMEGLITWMASATAVITGQAVMGWILNHMGMNTAPGTAEVLLRRGRQVL